MHPESSATLPRGRPPARVLLALTLIASVVHGWLTDPASRERAHANALKLARPQAAETIARRVLEAVSAAASRVG